MGITEYIGEREKGKVFNDTLMQKLFEGYVALGKTVTNEAGEVEYAKLKDGDNVTRASNAMYSILKDFSVSHWKAGVTNDDEKAELAFRTFGLGLDQVVSYLDENKEAFNPMQFTQFIMQKTAFGYFQNRNTTERPKSKLSDKDANTVVEYTKTAGQVDASKLSVDEMAELLAQYLDEKTVPLSFLKGKKYFIETETAAPAAEAGAAAEETPAAGGTPAGFYG